MTSSTKTWVIVVLSVIILAGIWLFGFYSYPKVYPRPLPVSNTVYMPDTVHHYVYAIWPWYVEKLVSVTYKDKAWVDSVMAANKVDSAGILEQFYATFQYERAIADTNIVDKDTTIIGVKWVDAISQNKPMAIEGFDYFLKYPKQVINNLTTSTIYNKYITFGFNAPLNDMRYSTIEATFVTPKYYFGGGYNIKLQTATVKTGITLFRFK